MLPTYKYFHTDYVQTTNTISHHRISICKLEMLIGIWVLKKIIRSRYPHSLPEVIPESAAKLAFAANWHKLSRRSMHILVT